MTVYVVIDVEDHFPEGVFFRRSSAEEYRTMTGYDPRFINIIKCETGDDPLTEYETE